MPSLLVLPWRNLCEPLQNILTVNKVHERVLDTHNNTFTDRLPESMTCCINDHRLYRLTNTNNTTLSVHISACVVLRVSLQQQIKAA